MLAGLEDARSSLCFPRVLSPPAVAKNVKDGEKNAIFPHAVTKVDDSITFSDLGEFRRNGLVLEECVQRRCYPCHSSVVMIIGVGGPSSQHFAVVLLESASCALEIPGWNAVLLHA